jgi:murein DD-endopeptidase MepM/ murein hydrolase activator NlpD
MKSGESLYAIAQRHKVSVEELKRVNGIANATKVWAGKVLLVPDRPGAAAGPATPPRVVQAAPAPAVASEPEEDPRPAPAPAPAQKTARLNDGTATDAVPAPAVATGKFRWPARGKVIVGFGEQTEGGKSEGINLAVPLGTDIHAAEAGRVHYVGDGVKGYGNLILIRHANDWVTAYAHADRILVKANDEVKRGQVIGKAGKTGPVAQPQLRFELRKGSVPVDPLPYLAN